MTKILCVGDIHLSDKPPSNCTDSYNDDLFGLLTEIVDVASSRVVDAVVLSGDVFHSKRPDRTSHRTVQRMIDVVRSFPCPVYCVAGNHDMSNDRLASVFETQPLGVLFQSGLLSLDGWAADSSLPLYGVPWQQCWDAGHPAFEAWLSDVSGNSLVVAHAPLYPPGEENPFENIPAPIVAQWMGNRGFIYYGHVHDLHGAFESCGTVFCNQGALSRGSLHESDLTRRPAVTIWYSDRSGVEAFERVELLTAKPASEVFRLVEHATRVNYQDRLDIFLSSVASSTVQATSVESVIAHVQGMGLPKPETDLAVEILTASANGELRD